MIKGVNKQIIEINDIENKVFEKAVLYIRPEYSDSSISKLHNSAKEFISNTADCDLWCAKSEESFIEDKTTPKKIITSVIGTGLLILGVVITLIILL